jgi:hypothetical protein
MISRILTFILFIPWISVSAAQLDVAVLQFPEPKTAEEIHSALQGVHLADLTNADKTVTKISPIQGGQVLFAQSLPSAPTFNSLCRLSNSQSSMVGRFSDGVLSLKITLSEGVNSGLHHFTSRKFEGSASLPLGPARVIAIRNIQAKTKSFTKGNASVKEVFTCNLIVAQMR